LFSQKIKNIIFDLDGVLWNSSDIHNDCFRKALIYYNFDDVNFNYDEIAGMKTEEAFNKIFLVNKKHFNTDLVNKITLLKRKLFLELELRSYLNIKLINWIKADTLYSKSLASSASENSIMKFISISEIKNFDSIYSGQKVVKSKPAPEIYNNVIHDNKYNHEETLIVEDSFSGVKSALASGVFNIAHLKEYINKNNIIKNKKVYSFDNTESLLTCLKT
jgi:beta-phosphoglucomutase